MEKSIEKLFNEMLNQILTEKQVGIDELMNEDACMDDKLRIENDIIIMLQSIIMALKDKYEDLLHENHELIKYMKYLNRFLKHSIE